MEIEDWRKLIAFQQSRNDIEINTSYGGSVIHLWKVTYIDGHFKDICMCDSKKPAPLYNNADGWRNCCPKCLKIANPRINSDLAKDCQPGYA